MLFPDDRLPGTEWYNDWLRPQGYRYAIGGLVVKEESRAVKFTALRSPRLGEYSAEELRFYEALLPHLQRACEVHRQLALTRARERASAGALDQLPLGVWLFDQQGRATFANLAAQRVATRSNGLWLDATGTPCTESASQLGELRGLIARAVHCSLGTGRLGGGAMALRRAASVRPIQLLVSPFVQEEVFAPSGSPRAVAFFGDPDRVAGTPEAVMQRVFRLTRAEARFANALIAGQSVREYAEREELSEETVRTHLKRVLAKTGARRQQELVRIILSGPFHLFSFQTHDGDRPRP
jgi:DNA-binding CsgD family transcriptional regulator